MRPLSRAARRVPPSINGTWVVRMAGIVLLTGVSLGACQPESPRERAPEREAADAVQEGASSCPNEERVAAGGGRRRRGRLVADLDGRPGSERAWIASIPSERVDCSAWLVVEAALGRRVVPIAGTDDFASGALGLPALAGGARIDSRGGAEIVVDVTAGASTTFAAVFSLLRDSVVMVDLRGPGAPPNDLFAHGGSAAHVHAVDCAGPATVITTEAQANARRYSIIRRFFSAEGPVWRALPGRTERGTAAPRRLAAQWPEFGSFPFSSCGLPSD
jgi:hypothetical protein